MKKFENPTMDIEELKIIDVITTSTCDQDFCEGQSEVDAGEWSLRKIFG